MSDVDSTIRACPATSISSDGQIIPCLANHSIQWIVSEHGGWITLNDDEIWWISYQDDDRLPFNWVGA